MMARYPDILPASRILHLERSEPKMGMLDNAAKALITPVKLRLTVLQRRHLGKMVQEIIVRHATLTTLSDEALSERVSTLRCELLQQGMQDPLVIDAFALIREAAQRTLGMAHFDSQLLAGLAILRGMVIEMETGEGKTLSATLPAATAALAGVPVHVITVNDYLAERDASIMAPLYRWLGLSIGHITHGIEHGKRPEIYDCDVVYCTNTELAFDYLKDRIALGNAVRPLHLHAETLQGKRNRSHQLLLRGLHFAIVDEADSVLIDESRTPLVISGGDNSTDNGEERMMRQALALAQQLKKVLHFTVDRGEAKIELTEQGELTVAEIARDYGATWSSPVRQLELARQALSALYLFQLDKHYLIRDNKIQIIDEHTGRVMEGRSWERGLHQLIEIKEGCEVTRARETRARMSYQRFFRRYRHLGGMTGTVKEVSHELLSVYAVPTMVVPSRRASRRINQGTRIFATAEEKWQAVCDRVKTLHESGRPVLIGVHSVASSEHLNEKLNEIGLLHRVLNAKNDSEEAAIVATAGEPGCITIATSMAGRGTDIKLADGVNELGGLHVILTERFEAARIDRQLAGRCARQGDAGSFEALLSMEDYLLERWSGPLTACARSRLLVAPGLRQLLSRWAMQRAQRQQEKVHRKVRRDVCKMDDKMGEILAFSGVTE